MLQCLISRLQRLGRVLHPQPTDLLSRTGWESHHAARGKERLGHDESCSTSEHFLPAPGLSCSPPCSHTVVVTMFRHDQNTRPSTMKTVLERQGPRPDLGTAPEITSHTHVYPRVLGITSLQDLYQHRHIIPTSAGIPVPRHFSR